MQLFLKENFWNTITALADPAKHVLSLLLGFWIKTRCVELFIVVVVDVVAVVVIVC